MDPDGVAIVGSGVSAGLALAEAERSAAAVATEVDDALPALPGDLPDMDVAQRPQQAAVEAQAARKRGDNEIQVVDRLHDAPIVAAQSPRDRIAAIGCAIIRAEIEARRALGHVALAAIERHVSSRSFLVAETFTIADIALYAYTHRAERGGFDLDRYPAIGRWLQRIAAQEGHVPMDAPRPR